MKSLIIACVFVSFAQSKVLPPRLSKLMCRKSVPNFSKCLWNNIERARPLLMEGIPELGLPGIDPLELSTYSVHRTFSKEVSIDADLKNMKMLGAGNAIIENLRANPSNLTLETLITIPWVLFETDYDLDGRIFGAQIKSKGHFMGNLTNTQIYVRGTLKYFTKNDEKYLKTHKLYVKESIGSGNIKITSDDPDLQIGAELITNMFNADPQTVLDILTPVNSDFYQSLLDEFLAKAPAEEWLPE